ncbi:unnamed protein product [Trichobilharzia regenti]|nr:unnamed protein product [Trichobilharzia regenti]
MKEIEEITSRLKSSRQQILDLERSASESKTVVNELHTGNNDLRSEVS